MYALLQGKDPLRMDKKDELAYKVLLPPITKLSRKHRVKHYKL